MTARPFAKVVTATTGQQCLFYVAPTVGEWTLHQIAYSDSSDFMADLAVQFRSADPFSILDKIDTEQADKLIAAVEEAEADRKGGAE